jgi:TatD DNase family protein
MLGVSASMRWIDAHCHLSDPRVSIEPLLSECRHSGIDRFVLGGVDPEDWERQDQLDLAHPSTFIKVFGLHPWKVDEWVGLGEATRLSEALTELERRLPGIRALGETGLDAARDRFKRSKAEQLRCFEAQVELAAHFSKPLVLHVVRAHAAALELLESRRSQVRGGLVHSFSGTWQDARRYLDLGLVLSVSARITFPDATDLHETVLKAPPDRLVFETDAPDQPPHGSTVKTNSPLSLLKVVQRASEIRSESPESLLDRSRDILTGLFQIT